MQIEWPNARELEGRDRGRDRTARDAARESASHPARHPPAEDRSRRRRGRPQADRPGAEGADWLQRPELGVHRGAGPCGEGAARAAEPPCVAPVRRARPPRGSGRREDAEGPRRGAVAGRPLRGHPGSRRRVSAGRPAAALPADAGLVVLRLHLPLRAESAASGARPGSAPPSSPSRSGAPSPRAAFSAARGTSSPVPWFRSAGRSDATGRRRAGPSERSCPSIATATERGWSTESRDLAPPWPRVTSPS